MNRLYLASQFDDLPQSSTKSVETVDAQKETIVPQVVYATATEVKEKELDRQNVFNFEERLSKWILERVIHRYELAKKIEDRTVPPEILLIKGSTLATICQITSTQLIKREQRRLSEIVQILFVIFASPITSILSALGQLSTDFSVRPSIIQQSWGQGNIRLRKSCYSHLPIIFQEKDKQGIRFATNWEDCKREGF